MRLVADANILLAALIGGRARVALTHPSVQEVYTAAATLGEVQEYVSALARKKRLPLDVLLLALAALPVVVVERADYERKMPEATRRLVRRDPDDVDVLALALHLGVPRRLPGGGRRVIHDRDAAQAPGRIVGRGDLSSAPWP